MATDHDRAQTIEELERRLDALLSQAEALRSAVKSLAESDRRGAEPDPSAILDQIRRLEPGKRRRLREALVDLDLEAIEAKEPRGPYRNLEGIFAHRGVDVTEEDIAEARREKWGNYPRDVEL